MYFTVDLPLTSIVYLYVVFAGASIITYPLMKLLVNSMSRGVSKWK